MLKQWANQVFGRIPQLREKRHHNAAKASSKIMTNQSQWSYAPHITTVTGHAWIWPNQNICGWFKNFFMRILCNEGKITKQSEHYYFIYHIIYHSFIIFIRNHAQILWMLRANLYANTANIISRNKLQILQLHFQVHSLPPPPNLLVHPTRSTTLIINHCRFSINPQSQAKNCLLITYIALELLKLLINFFLGILYLCFVDNATQKTKTSSSRVIE